SAACAEPIAPQTAASTSSDDENLNVLFIEVPIATLELHLRAHNRALWPQMWRDDIRLDLISINRCGCSAEVARLLHRCHAP
ncbi:MAG: hypothetical protein E6833_32715, partial [Bradyrhizobium sp.]|nr:hypothetical protein [Bradyrhizobium sp.]